MSATDEPIGLVPAAGKGLRLGLPYPKELYPIIAGGRYKPVAQHVVDTLVGAGARHLVVVINETKHQLIGYFGDGARFGCRISYVFQDPYAVRRVGAEGLAEAIDAAYHLIRGRIVLFGMPDTIVEPSGAYGQLLPAIGEGADLHLGLFPTDVPEQRGVVDHDEDGRVRRVLDKQPDQGLRECWGILAWSPAFTERLHEGVASPSAPDFTTIVNGAISAGMRVRATSIAGGRYSDLGTYESIERLDREQREREPRP